MGLSLFILAGAASVLAAPLTFDVRADRADQLYVPGERAEFTVTCRGADGAPATSGVVVAWLDNFGDRTVSSQKFDLSRNAAFVVSGTLDEPGFLRLTLSAEKPDSGRRVWSVGFAPHKIRAGAECPKDFDAFWQAAREKLAREVPLDPQVKRIESRSTDEFDFYSVSFATFGRRLYGFMSIPKGASAAKRYPVLFSLPGAGFGDWSQNMYGSADEIRLSLTVYDWEPRGADWPKDQAKYDAMEAAASAKWGVGSYATTGISGGRETSFFYPVILGADRVIDWLATRPEVDVNRFRYWGSSQGGMMGFILTGLNKHILRSLLFVPAGCDQLAYKVRRRCGWPNFTGGHPDAAKRAAAEKWAPYFDAANFAKNITCPIRVFYGFSDETCCAPSVWSAFNAAPSQDKTIHGGVGIAHAVTPEVYEAGHAWLRENSAHELEPATPESQGVSSAAILRWLEVCEKTLDAVHGFVLVRHGKTIAEGWWAPQSADRLHELYSHSKSFTSSAVGLLVDDGKLDLDECVADILPEKIPTNATARLRAVRVRDLLTMNFGCDRDHQLREPGDWAAQTLAKPLVRDGGRGFRYDSDATYLLACIVERKAGMKLMDFLRQRMLGYIGIRPDVFSTVSPQDVACGGWGMSMTTRDLARFGQLYLQQGRWGDRQILSPEWVRLASSCQTRCGWNGQTAFGNDDWHRGYGFQFWRCRHGAFRADGANGQLTIVMPEEDAVLSVTASLGPMQDEVETLWNVLLPAMKAAPLPEDAAAQAKLKAKLASLKLKTVAGAKTDAIGAAALGKTWKLDQTEKGLHLKDVSLVEKGPGWLNLVVTGDMGKETFPIGFGEWTKGCVALDPCTYGKLSAILGVQDVYSSGAWIKPGVLQVKTQFVSTIFTGTWTLDFTAKDCVKFSYSAAGYSAAATGRLTAGLFSGCLAAEKTEPYVFGCDCIVNDCVKELNTPEGRRRAIDWFRRHHVSKIYVESFRHGESVPTPLLRTIRDDFRAAGLVVGGCFTPTSLSKKARAANAAKIDYQQWCCYTDPDVLSELDEEVARAASLFDFVIIDDFLFTHCTCERCTKAKGSSNWADFRCALIRDVCRRIDAVAKRANPKCTFIVKFPCWYAGFRNAGYDVAADAKALGAAWIGTETRDAGEPAQAFWIQAWANEATGGLCGGGWFDSLMTSDPRKYVEQARYTILGGAKETLLHCYWHLAAPEPSVDPKHEYRRVIRWHDCAEAFRREVEGLEKLAAVVRDAELEGVRWARPANATGGDRGVKMLRGGVPVKPVLEKGEPSFPFDENTFARATAGDLEKVHAWVAERTGWHLAAPGDVTLHLYRKGTRRLAALVNLRDEAVDVTLAHRDGGTLSKVLSLPDAAAAHCASDGKIRLSPKSMVVLALLMK